MSEMMPIINSPNKGHPDNNKGFIKIREVNKHGIILQSTRTFLIQEVLFQISSQLFSNICLSVGLRD